MIAGVQVEIMEESEGLHAEAALVRLHFRVLPSDVTVEIVLSGESAVAEVADEILRHVRVVRVLMLAQLVLVEEGLAAVVAVEWFVLLVAQQVRHDLLSVRVRLLTDAAAVRDVLLVVLAVPDDVGEREDHVAAHHALMVLVRVRLHVLHHVVMCGEDLRADDADVLVVVGPVNGGLLQQLADQHVPVERRLRVELLVARLAKEIIPRPVFLQAHLELSVVHHHVPTDLELAHERLAADRAVVIFPDVLLRLLQVLVHGGDVSGD